MLGFYAGDICSFVKDNATNLTEKTFVALRRGSPVTDDTVIDDKEKNDNNLFTDKRKEKMAKHEDFHSFINKFNIEGNYAFGTVVTDIEKLLKMIKTEGEKPAGIPDKITDLKRKLHKMQDFGQEEILAEIACGAGPNSLNATFGATIQHALKLLKEAKGVDPEIDQIISETESILDINKIQKRFQGFYAECPEEKRDDLDIAFALFPPSQWRHVEQLVKRWREESTGENTKPA